MVVPARNEEGSVAACVLSVRAALRRSGHPGRIVVVADRCSDETALVARRALGPDGDVLLSSVGRAGAARGVGAAHVLAHAHAPRSTWLATTDADGTVPSDWLAVQLSHARAGAAAVAGIVVLDERADAVVAARHRASYAIGPDGAHPHVHGANLGVRGDAYLDVGGWSRRLRAGEDQLLWSHLQARHWPVIATTRSWVTTSSRSVSRVEGGFATDLARLAHGPGAAVEVAPGGSC